MSKTSKQIKEIFKTIDDKREEITMLEESEQRLLDGLLPGGMRYDLERVQTTPVNKTEEVGWKIIQIGQQISKKKEELINDMLYAISIIERMPTSIYRTILWMKYIEGLKWKDIAKKKTYDETYLRGEMQNKAMAEAAAAAESLTKTYIEP